MSRRGNAIEWLCAGALLMMVIWLPATIVIVGRGHSAMFASFVSILIVGGFILFGVGLGAIAATNSPQLARLLAAAGAIAYSLSAWFSGSWPLTIIDLLLALSLLLFCTKPQLLYLLPERAKFDWAGAFGEGFSAPRDAKFEYAFRPLALTLITAPFVVRGVFSCLEAFSLYSAGSSVSLAVPALLGSGLAYAASLPFVSWAFRDQTRDAA